jgi:hypothetical protein
LRSWWIVADAARGGVVVALVVAAFLSPPPAWACSCKKPSPDFWQVAEKSDVVVVAEITRHLKPDPRRVAFGFEIRVVEVIKGQDPRETIQLINHSPSNCSLVPPDLVAGGRWAIVLMPGSPGEGDFGMCWPRLMELAGPRSSGPTIEELKRRLGSVRPARPVS